MTMASMLQQGSSMRAMARMLGRSASTISRELERNTLAELPYASHSARFAARGGARPHGLRASSTCKEWAGAWC